MSAQSVTPRARRPVGPGLLRASQLGLHLAGITLVFLASACARSNAPPAADPQDLLVAQLRTENAALEQRVSDLQAERDRLRAKVDALAPDSEPEGEGSTEAPPTEPEGSPSGDLPVVKLLPTDKAPGSPTSPSPASVAEGNGPEVEEEEPRPILRAYGEEEGEVIHAGAASTSSKPGSTPRKSSSLSSRTSP